MDSYKKYILDPLYGIIFFPRFVWDVMLIPEVQRLRELRLSNINSLYLTGSANINRFEHSVGTCYLATKCMEEINTNREKRNLSKISEHHKKLFILSALLHDVFNASFGHSVEYVEGYKPENLFYHVASNQIAHSEYKAKSAMLEPIFFGLCSELTIVLKEKLNLTNADIKIMSEYINGNGDIGVLLSGTIDLDNIDNVYRMAYHMGLVERNDNPEKIAKSMCAIDNTLYFNNDITPLIRNWVEIRNLQYKILLFNPDELSAKYMLTEAIEKSKKNYIKSEVVELNCQPFRWYDTDSQLIEKLSSHAGDVHDIVSNLMNGKLYCCLSIISTNNTKKYSDFMCYEKRNDIEKRLAKLLKPEAEETVSQFQTEDADAIKGMRGISYDKDKKILKIDSKLKKRHFELLKSKLLPRHKDLLDELYQHVDLKKKEFKITSPIIGLHSILDINRTSRKIDFTLSTGEKKSVGDSIQKLYVGVFLKNKEFTNADRNEVYNIDSIRKIILEFFSHFFNDTDTKEIELYSEQKNVRGRA